MLSIKKSIDEERQIITVEVFDLTYNEYEMNAHDFIKWITETIEDVPAEFRDSILVKAERDYEGYNTIIASYERPETNIEVQKRLEKESKWEERELNRDRCEYERLKAKFG